MVPDSRIEFNHSNSNSSSNSNSNSRGSMPTGLADTVSCPKQGKCLPLVGLAEASLGLCVAMRHPMGLRQSDT